jgi:hypothetical protein
VKAVVFIGLYALMGLGLYALGAGNISWGLTLKPLPPFAWFSISDRVARYSCVCFVFASFFHLIWAVWSKKNIDPWIDRYTVQMLLFLLGRTLFFFILCVCTLALSSADITKQPFGDGAIYRSVLTSCFLLGAWSWNAVPFTQYLHGFLRSGGQR